MMNKSEREYTKIWSMWTITYFMLLVVSFILFAWINALEAEIVFCHIVGAAFGFWMFGLALHPSSFNFPEDEQDD